MISTEQSTNDSPRKPGAARFLPLRGLRGAVFCALTGAASSILLALGFTLLRWRLSGASELDLWDDLRQLSWSMTFPVVGCAAFCGCAGWATFAPFGHHQFARSLAILAVVSLPISMMLATALPRRWKGSPVPFTTLRELAVVFGPLIVVTAVLTGVRLFRSAEPIQYLE